MANFILIGREIINLDLVARVEHGDVPQGDPEVIIFYVGDEEKMHSRFSGAQAEAVWRKFQQMADKWDVPAPEDRSPGGPGRTAQSV